MNTMLRLSLFALALLVSVPGFAATSDSSTPQPVSTTAPKYPYLMRRAEAAAEVTVVFTVSERGTVTGAQVKNSSNIEFNAAALAAIRRWTFAPARQDGRPVASRLQQTFVFSVQTPPETDGKAFVASKPGSR